MNDKPSIYQDLPNLRLPNNEWWTLYSFWSYTHSRPAIFHCIVLQNKDDHVTLAVMKYVQTTSSQSRRTEMVYENISGPFLSHLWSQIFSTAAKGTLFFWIYSTETFDLWESFSSTVYKTVSSWIGTKTIIEQNDPKFVQLKHKRRIGCIYHQTFNRPTEAAMPAYIWRKITGDINNHQASNKWI